MKMMRIHDQCPCRKVHNFNINEIPFGLLNEEWAMKNHDQSLSRLNERGGITVSEALAIIGRRRWYEMDTNRSIIVLTHILVGYNIGFKANESNKDN